MRLSELNFEYPDDLIATQPIYPCRVLHSRASEELAQEISHGELLDLFGEPDLLIVNNSKVIPRRIFSSDGSEIVFVQNLGGREWSVLFPVRGRKIGTTWQLPGDVQMTLLEKGRPQRVEVSTDLSLNWFESHGELPLPPYIQKARGERHNIDEDRQWYQNHWAGNAGSLAAPTAGLHFKESDFQAIKDRGAEILEVTLHVGLGTFLPISADNIDDHVMHSEAFSVSEEVAHKIQGARERGVRVSALGTTVTRVLETLAARDFRELSGHTDLFIRPGYRFQVVDRLLTNFHQPGSTLLALVCAFAGKESVLDLYRHAVENRFRLFSYGDLTVWDR